MSDPRKPRPTREEALISIGLVIGGAAVALGALLDPWAVAWVLAGLLLNAGWVTYRYLIGLAAPTDR
jgi:hypothetical protein